MLRATSDFVANKLIFVNRINEVGHGKVIGEYNNTKFGTEFPIPRAKVAFAGLKQTFSIAPVLHYLELKCHILIEMNASDQVIDRIFSLQTSDDLGQ